MKSTKLAKSELVKLFMRPAIYFLTGFLVVALILVSIIYNPTPREDNKINFGTINQTVSDVFSVFNDSSSTDKDAKINIDKNLNEAYNRLNTFNTASDLRETIITKIEKIQTFMTQSSGSGFYNLLITLANNPNDENARKNFINALSVLREDALSIFTFLDTEINSENIDFYITQNQLTHIKDFFYKLATIIAREAYLQTYQSDELINLGNRISEDYDVSLVIEKLTSYKKIELNQDSVNQIINKYYNKIVYTGKLVSSTYDNQSGINTTNDEKNENNENQNESQEDITVLDEIYTQAVLFVSKNADSKESKDIDDLNLILTQYKNASIISTNLINASFAIEKAKGYSDKEINNYIGFSGFNSGTYKEQIQLNEYLLNNKIFDGKYLNNFNINSTIGTEVSAYDFAFFAMQILSFVITIFAIFFTVSSIAGEQAGGTMKMLAMRPYTKTKIITGKLLSCICFSLMFVVIASITSFVVGFSLFGMGSEGNIIVVFNSSFAFELPAILVFIIYLIMLMFNIIFYIMVSDLLSVILRSTAFATFITFIIYLAGIIINAVWANTTWYVFLPFAHLDLFKYFGGASSSPQLFGINTILDGNFLVSLIVIIGLILIMDVATKVIFKKRDIS